MTHPTSIAHRCYAGVAPENTIGAGQFAAELEETAMLEIDVRPAACGTPVVFHDDRLEGKRGGRPMTDATGAVRETSLETLERVRVLGTDEHVPSLAAFLEAVPETMAVNVELKSPGIPASERRPGVLLSAEDRERQRTRWLPFVERVVAACDAFDGELLFSSFCAGALTALRDVAPTYAAATLCLEWEVGLEVARRYDCAAIHPPMDAFTDGSIADMIEQAHADGRAVNVWTVTEWHQYERFATAGVDGVIVDYPLLGRYETMRN